MLFDSFPELFLLRGRPRFPHARFEESVIYVCGFLGCCEVGKPFCVFEDLVGPRGKVFGFELLGDSGVFSTPVS